MLEAELSVLAEARDPDPWEPVAMEALSIRRARGEMLGVANALTDVGQIAWLRRDVDVAKAAWKEAASLYETLAPASAQRARGLSNLGIVTRGPGAIAEAEQLDRRALAIVDALPGRTIDHADLALNLGIDLREQGQFAAAEELYLKALAIHRALNPEGRGVARVLLSLANLAHTRGDRAAAEDYGKRALALHQALDPDALDTANVLNSLGAFADARGDLGAAEEHYRRALAIQERHAPGSVDIAMTYTNLGILARKRGDLEASQRLLERALEIQTAVAAQSLRRAVTLVHLARIATIQKAYARSDELLLEALALRERLAPGSEIVAESLWSLGELRERQGREDEEVTLALRALNILDQQRRRLGGSDEARSAFSAKFVDLYRDTVDVLARLGRSAEAFHVLERSRAWSLMVLLSQRALALEHLLPQAQEELRQINADDDEAQGELCRLDPAHDADAVARVSARLHELVLAGALLLVPAGPASAAVVKISQLRALIGGVTPGDAPGFPVTLSRPGSYQLVTNLVLPAGATFAIDATADGVSLDLNGFAVIGPRTCAPETVPPAACAPSIEDPGFVGIRARNNAFIHDGTVQGMGGEGIQAGSHARIVNVRVLWNSIFGLQLGPGSRLDDNLVAQNRGGVFLGNDCRATGNVVRLNTFAGLQDDRRQLRLRQQCAERLPAGGRRHAARSQPLQRRALSVVCPPALCAAWRLALTCAGTARSRG